MARALLIANPAAARTDGGVIREIERVFNMAGWQVETLATGGPGDARQLAEYGVQQSVDLVAVLGGDGTIMQAAAGMVGTGVPLGVLPGGRVSVGTAVNAGGSDPYATADPRIRITVAIAECIPLDFIFNVPL